MAGTTIDLDTVTNGVLSATPLQTALTDQNGFYSFQNLGPLPEGTSYAVVEEPVAGRCRRPRLRVRPTR